MTQTDVIVVDDQTVFREMLVELLELEPQFRVVGHYRTGQEALDALATVRPQLAILDVVLPDIDGVALMERLRASCSPPPRIVLVTAHPRTTIVQRAFEAGAQGIVMKSAPLRQLREGIETVRRGGIFYCPETTALVHEIGSGRASKPTPLTQRERSVLRLVALGKSSKEIADELGIRTKTVSNHRARIMEKLSIRDIAGLTRYAVQQGLVELT